MGSGIDDHGKQNIHPVAKFQEEKKYLEGLGLSEEERRLMNAMDIALKHYSENHIDAIDQKLKQFENNIQPIFEKIVEDHLIAVQNGVNAFIEAYNKENTTPNELKASMEHLSRLLNSKPAQEARSLSNDDLKAIYDRIVPVLRDEIVEGFTDTNNNLTTSHKVIVDINNANTRNLYNEMVKFRNEIMQNVNEAKIKIDASTTKRMH